MGLLPNNRRREKKKDGDGVRTRPRIDKMLGTGIATGTERGAKFVRSSLVSPFSYTCSRCTAARNSMREVGIQCAKEGLGTELDIDTRNSAHKTIVLVPGHQKAPLRGPEGRKPTPQRLGRTVPRRT